jgi:7,8-dihydropterin-6-yl-methyl-4-(beta-D-ribofuranosyl)aminobenzene 5'-phosphate synthase
VGASINPKISFIAGGFHLVVAKDPDIETIITTLRDTYKVAYVAPGHCTGEPTFTALKKAFGEHYLYAGLGSTFALEGTPHLVGVTADSTSSALSDDDLQSYQALFATSSERRRGLFTALRRSSTSGGAYLAQWRRSMAGCC